ncbi:hypothetical protein C923_05588 [Plasmodium falciparum UGT5.1]|uniref:Uncharacterized protein n=6 Tax=Plasmodium falciparum TaxID=5833 RepID=W4IWE7_PLAFP|nr:hypothetical protein PFFVO_05096 [Plasmodium falciparum Vietnam Oak-Knoll (FVO)]ETW39792.1 hypothetical protein PFNF135_05821 [Plasmodium falciparum NF135/5.C10]ETW46664.1 hypothetical protein PFMALIP_05300 [Plasmodium falciparum MaliPS096_E11]ETW54129.1 hypothetical protein PFUGPA_03999 [Plasmodium falciparum Palo Alto/Uganda]ETW58436.1 hypothetical protein PFMC_05536 [Plasmodium falciparum CAMP/Malaysia]EWC73710.1 hypothetical protein C923_05588 [Plasmodium falciparum UGT5.1]
MNITEKLKSYNFFYFILIQHVFFVFVVMHITICNSIFYQIVLIFSFYKKNKNRKKKKKKNCIIKFIQINIT